MLKNEEIIVRLSLEEKVKLLVFKNTKNNFEECSLDVDKLKEKMKNISSIVLYNNSKNISFKVLSTFFNIILKDINNLLSFDDTNIKLIKSNDLDVFNSLENNLLYLTVDAKTKQREIYAKVKANISLEKQLKEETITEDEYNEGFKQNDSLTEDKIDVLLDKLLEVFVPLIETVENPNNVKKEYDDSKGIFSTKFKVITFSSLLFYYNVLMIFVYLKREAISSVDTYIYGIWAFINFVLIILLIRSFPRVKAVKAPVEEFITTNDFEIVVPEEEVVVKFSNVKFDEVSLKDLTESFNNFLLERGLEIDYRKNKDLFASMAASRLVLINNKNNNDLEFLNALNEFFGNETFYSIVDDNASSDRDVFYKDDKVNDFIKGICHASNNTSNVNICSLMNVDLETCNLYLNSLANFSKNPNEKGTIILEKEDFLISDYVVNKKLAIPKNTWFILFTKEDSGALSNRLVNEAILLDLDIKTIAKKETNTEHKILSSVNFMDGINTAREESFLSNESWDKIDEIEKQLKEKFNFAIENKIVRKLEVYASVYKKSGADEKTTLDSTISNVLLPIIFFGQENVYNTVLEVLKEVLEDENMLLTKENLNKYK
ncbi:MAG: hypothetical protein R3Y60_00670 [bacterium]